MDAVLNPFIGRLKAHAEALEAEFERLLGAPGRPVRLVAAMRHAVLGGGKRMRPALVFDGAALFGLGRAAAMPAALAIELVHAYSLVHDDLPAMDNDDMRRGLPTVHRAYDEATAILAGDALLTLAFEVVAGVGSGALVTGLARAAGIDGMVGGQMLDLAAEGRFADMPPEAGLAAVARLQALKTGALITFSATAGAILAGRPEADRAALAEFGAALGLAFQIRDDLLDLQGDPERVGKRLGKDEAAGKATFIGLLGAEGAARRLEEATAAGLAALARLPGQGGTLAEYLHFNRSRES